MEDVYNCVPFDDCVVAAGFPVDIHDPAGSFGLFEPPRGHHYEIPYRCLLPLKVDNLLVAGRCVSATHEALGAIRVMPFALVWAKQREQLLPYLFKMVLSLKKLIRKNCKSLSRAGCIYPSNQSIERKFYI